MQVPISELELRLADANATGERAPRLAALNDLSWALRLKDGARAHALAGEARALALELGDGLAQARAARTLAMTVQDSAGLQAIFELAHEAMRLFDEADDAAGRAASRDFLATIHEFVGDLAGGMEYAQAALRIARELGDPVRQGYALSSVGGLLAASGDVDAAVARLEEGLSLFERDNHTDGIQTMYSRLCRVLKQAGRVDEALALAERCLAEGDARDNRFMRSSALMVMAELAAERGDPSAAEGLYRESLTLWEPDLGRDVMGAEADLALARLMGQRGAIAEAEALVEDLLRRLGDNTVAIVSQAAGYELLADLKELAGEPAAALAHLRKARALQQRIAQRDSSTKLAQIEVRAALEAARRDAEIHKLRFVELHSMQAKLVEAEKMALLGKLAAGTAHELNSPLGVLRSNLDVTATAVTRLLDLLAKAGERSTRTDAIEAALRACHATNEQALERLASIAQSFARFTQLDQAEQRAFDVRDGLASALTLLDPTLPTEVMIERDFAPVPPVQAFPRELNYAFLTVIQNAAQAIDGAGRIRVETRASGEQVLVRVIDTGRGMSDDQVKHLFDAAWSETGTRTKMRLGLSAAYTTLQKHGGAIEVESALGQGTTVTFRLMAHS